MAEPTDSVQQTDEEIAAIVAALAAYVDTEPGALRVTAVRRTEVPVRSLWGLVGRQQQHAARRMYQMGRSRR